MRTTGHATIFGLAIAMAASALLPGVAAAHDADPRLRPVAPLAGSMLPPIVVADPAARMLPRRARYGLVETSTREKVIDTGPLTLVVSESQLGLSQVGTPAVRVPDRNTAIVGGLDAGIDVVDGFSVHALTGMARARRRFRMLSGYSRAIATSVMSLGVGVQRAATGALTFEYIRSSIRASRDPMAHFAEQVGANMPVGKTMRLSLTNAIPGDRSGRLTWTLSADTILHPVSVMRLAVREQLPVDHRADIALHFAL